MFRLFVGIPLPSTIRARLAGLCSGVPGARWVAPENMHITLRFIGAVSGGDAEDIHERLSGIVTPAFALTLNGVGCFESGRRVHALWVGINREPQLIRLADKVESAIVRAGMEPERRKFKPHVTLARFRTGGSPRIGAFIESNNPFTAGPFAVEHFTLFRSFLGGEGAHYESLADYPLQTAPAVPLASAATGP
jgi:RNA 2',3'-cyclic 3'-phosphodiesterase